MTPTALLKMTPESIETATSGTKTTLENIKAKTGFVPNMYGYMAKLPGVLEGYLSTYESFRETAGFTPTEQEVVFLVISRFNGCTYCMAAHSMLADKVSGVPADMLAAVRAGEPLPDDKLQALATFTETMVDTRGNPDRAAIDAFLAAGYGEQHILGIILGIACKTFSNYVNHLAGTPVDDRFADYKVD